MTDRHHARDRREVARSCGSCDFQYRGDDISYPLRALHVMGAEDAASTEDAEGVGRMTRLPTVLDLEVEQLAEKGLVRGRQQHRPSHRRQLRRVPKEHDRLLPRLPEIEPGIED